MPRIPRSAEKQEVVTITLPIHPLVGQTLPVTLNERDRVGRRFVHVEKSPGDVLRLPVEWTDRGPPVTAAIVGEGAIRLSVLGLLDLAVAVKGLGQKLDKDLGPETVREESEQTSRSNTARPSHRMVGSIQGDADDAPRGMGDADSQGDSRGGRGR